MVGQNNTVQDIFQPIAHRFRNDFIINIEQADRPPCFKSKLPVFDFTKTSDNTSSW